MTSTEILLLLAQLLGGLTFFLFGMSVMSGGLEQMAGGGLERAIKKVTSKQFLSFFLGAGITIAIQSSSAMTVMLVGLVNSGIMNFADTFGMIMGSNVGTTLTAWILTLTGVDDGGFLMTLLQPMTFAPILAFVGIAFHMLSKKDKHKYLGSIFIGFAILMTGMDSMSNAMRDFRGLGEMLGALSSPLLALLASTLFTGVIQSSAATVAIVQAFALSGVLTYQQAIPLVIGANIGTCVTSFISSIGTNTGAKRVATMHAYVNAIGGSICVAIMYIIMAVSPDFMAQKADMVSVAVIHTLFNLGITLIFTPFRKQLIHLCEITFRKKEDKQHTVFLDERLFNNPALALSECHNLTNEMAEHTRSALVKAIGLLNNYNEADYKYVEEMETLTDKYEDKLGTYLVKLSSATLSEHDSHAVARLIHSIGDLERISDHALNICDVAKEIKEKNIVFSSGATKGIAVITRAVSEIVEMTFDSFKNDDADLAARVEPLEQVIDKLRDELKAQHVERLQKGDCTIQLGFVFSDLLTNYARVSDHCSNIAVYTMQLNSSMLDTHKYLGKVKSAATGAFVDEFNHFDEKYSLED